MASIASFPNVLASDQEKKTEKFGMDFIRAVYTSWIDGSMNGESRTNRKQRFDYNRAFAMGKQPMQEYMDILDINGELSVVNLDYSSLPIAISFIERIQARYASRDEKVIATAVDPLSQIRKKTARDNAVFKMAESPRIAVLQQESGVHIEDFKDDDPQDESEIDIEYGFNYKEREEVLIENGLEMVLYDNDWDGTLRSRINRDNICCGYAPTAVEVDGNGRIKLRSIMPENFISSASEFDDFRDWQYQGEAYYMSIMDIRQLYPNKISEKRLFDLAKSQVGKNNNPTQMGYGWDYNYTNSPGRPYDQFRVEVIRVVLKTLDNIKYEVSEDRFGKEVLDKKSVEMEGKEYIKSPAYFVAYEGIWITDTNVLLKWGLMDNMIKPEDNLQEVLSPYVCFLYNNTRMGNTPLIETMIPSIKIMQLTWLQQQKIIASAAPDGYIVDIAFMSDITLGEGMNNLSPHELYKIYKQTGIIYTKSLEDDGDGRRPVPITPQNVPFSGKLEQLMAVWNAEYDKLQRIVGDNNLASGYITNQATGKGVMENASAIAQGATNYLYGSYLNVKRRVSILAMHRLMDILLYGKKFGVFYYDGYRKALGTDRVENMKIESTDDLQKCAFDIMIQVVIDDDAKIQLNNDINAALTAQTIEFYDAVDIRRVAQTDIKYASYLMASRIKRRKREAREEAMQNSQANTQAAVSAAQAKAQGEAGVEQVKHGNKMQELTVTHENSKELEIIKSLNILKGEVVKGVLAKEGSTYEDVPSFVWSGMGIVDVTQKEIMFAALKSAQMINQAGQQAQMAQQLQVGGMQDPQTAPPQEQQPQQQVA